MNYMSTAKRVQKMLKQYGRIVMVTEPATVDIITGTETAGQAKSVYAIETANRYKPIDGTIITAKTKVYLASSYDTSDLPIEIGVGHKIDGLQVKLVERVSPDGTVIVYRVYAE